MIHLHEISNRGKFIKKKKQIGDYLGQKVRTGTDYKWAKELLGKIELDCVGDFKTLHIFYPLGWLL